MSNGVLVGRRAECTRRRGNTFSLKRNKDVKIGSITTKSKEVVSNLGLLTQPTEATAGGLLMHDYTTGDGCKEENLDDRGDPQPRSFVNEVKYGGTGIPALDRSLLDFGKYEDGGRVYLAPIEVGSWRLLGTGEVIELISELEHYLESFSDEQIALENQHRGRSQPQENPEAHSCHDKEPIPGYVYLLHVTDTSRYKIGLTTNLNRRIKQIGKQSPYPIELVHSFYTSNCSKSESNLHIKYDSFRIHGEWFELSDEQVEEFKAIANRGGLQ